MKKKIFLGLAIAVMALNPLVVSAATDSKYPAADSSLASFILIKMQAAKDQAQQSESDQNIRPPASRL